jgi:hypothetical protein
MTGERARTVTWQDPLTKCVGGIRGLFARLMALDATIVGGTNID